MFLMAPYIRVYDTRCNGTTQSTLTYSLNPKILKIKAVLKTTGTTHLNIWCHAIELLVPKSGTASYLTS